MSKLGTVLSEIMERHHTTGSALAEASGVPASTISRLRNGEISSFSPEDFKAVLQCVTSDKGERAALIKAHLLDECYGPGSDLIEISIADKFASIREVPPNYGLKLRKDIQEAFDAIAHALEGDQDLQQLIFYLAEIYKRKESP